ncbi:MAG: hypothetical protein IJF07_05450 [Lachnospiraceae bacterium]|nr:hypothetical protein [Lachnospiraceae bacterium]
MDEMTIFYKAQNASTVKDLVEFLELLADDYKRNVDEWENVTIDTYLEAVAGFIEDNNSELALDPIAWDADKVQAAARAFYMGKIYE